MTSGIRAFVAGATGYTGREVVRLLADTGAETYMHVRPDSKELARWQSYASTHGALLDTTGWRENQFVKRFAELLPTHVFALLGTTKSRAKKVGQSGGDPSLHSYESVDYALTMELLEAGAAMAQQPRFIYLSSAGSGPSAKGGYLKVRYRIESALQERYKNYVTIRPSFIAGPDRDEDRPMERVGAKVSDVFLKAFGALGAQRLRDRYSSITNVELARALVHHGLLDASSASIVEGEELQQANGF